LLPDSHLLNGHGDAAVSLFGKLVPLTQPFTQIPPEVTAILGKVLEDAGLKSPARKLCYEQLRELHDRLDVVMFDEILTYLPADTWRRLLK
jgi:hypothetical protein